MPSIVVDWRLRRVKRCQAFQITDALGVGELLNIFKGVSRVEETSGLARLGSPACRYGAGVDQVATDTGALDAAAGTSISFPSVNSRVGTTTFVIY